MLMLLIKLLNINRTNKRTFNGILKYSAQTGIYFLLSRFLVIGSSVLEELLQP